MLDPVARPPSGPRFATMGPLLFALAAVPLACGEDDAALAGNGGNGSNGFYGGNGSGAVNPGAPTSSDQGVVVDPEVGELPTVHPFVRTTHDPFSTFAADVDTASYDIFVKSLQDFSRLPSPQMIRTEEFVNFFRYAYPSVEAEADHPFVFDLDLGPTPSAETVTLRVGVQAKGLPADRPGANLVFLIDVSGSMGAEDKLPLAKTLLQNMLDVLEPEDTIALVTYASSTGVRLAPTAVSERDTLISAIRGLDAGGSTAGADGLQLAYAQAEAGYKEGGINHIVLCTDGDFNVGPYTTDELLEIVEDRRSGGVTFTALGFGLGNLNDGMMEAISNAGNGIYRVISGQKTADRYIASQRLLGDVVHVAKDVKLQIEFNPEHVYAWRQIGYENRQLADDEFRDDLIDAGEIGSGHQMTALYELALTDAALPAPDGAPEMADGDAVEGDREVTPGELVAVKLRYKHPGASETDAAIEMRSAVPAGPVADALSSEARFAWAVAALGQWLRQDPFDTDERMAAAARIIDEASVSGAPPARRELEGWFGMARSAGR